MARHDTLLRSRRVQHYLETTRVGLRVSEIHNLLRRDGFDVDVRTVHRDLEALGQARVPLRSSGSGSESRWSLASDAEIRRAVSFTYDEILALFVARKSLTHLEQTPLFGAIESVFTKLEKLIGPDGDTLREIDENLSFKPPSSWQGSVAPEIVATVYGALVEGHPLRMIYRSEFGAAAGQAVERRVGPESLFFAEGGLYLFAVDLAKDEVRTYALARIVSVEMMNDVAYERRGLSPTTALESAFGIVAIGEVAPVEIRITGPLASFVSERRWHPSQTTRAIEGGVVLSLNVRINEDLARFVLGLGPTAEVIGPSNLIDLVARLALDVAAVYARRSA